MKIKLYTG